MDAGDECIAGAAVIGVYDKSGRLVDEKNVLILIDDIDVRLGVQVRFLLTVLFRLSEKLIIDVQL